MNILIVTLSHIYLHDYRYRVDSDAFRTMNVYQHNQTFLSNVRHKSEKAFKKKKNVAKSRT